MGFRRFQGNGAKRSRTISKRLATLNLHLAALPTEDAELVKDWVECGIIGDIAKMEFNRVFLSYLVSRRPKWVAGGVVKG